jgi:hypothetical protein
MFAAGADIYNLLVWFRFYVPAQACSPVGKGGRAMPCRGLPLLIGNAIKLDHPVKKHLIA